jgi:hypothetical protein
VHTDLAPVLHALAERTAGTRLALVHGDVSPKNILVGPAGPVFLDAECAWYGDPAFDLAFCLNHLLLKGAWVPKRKPPISLASTRLRGAISPARTGRATDALEARAASLLPGLLLARVDGKSPSNICSRKHRRRACGAWRERFFRLRPQRLETVRERWQES